MASRSFSLLADGGKTAPFQFLTHKIYLLVGEQGPKTNLATWNCGAYPEGEPEHPSAACATRGIIAFAAVAGAHRRLLA